MSEQGQAFPHLFRPLNLRGRTLRNRIVFGAHTVNMSHEGLPGDRHYGYYRERARGGAAMIVVEPTPAHRTSVLIRGNLLAESDAGIEGFRRITTECKDLGAVMIHQIYHVGAHGDQDNSWEPYWSPSGIASMHDQWGSHKMTDAEVEEVIEAFVRQAERDQRAGFDGVDIFAGYNCLVDQFWSPLTNRRDDRWGGSLENRLRFSTRIAEGIRQRCGDDFIVGFTVTGAEPYQGGLTLDDKTEIVEWLDRRGLVDYFSVGSGSYLNHSMMIVASFHFPMRMTVEATAAFKAVAKHAVITTEARVKTPAAAEDVLAKGQADLVSIVRGQIADPHLANKAKEGRAEDVRPCISCNQLCIGRRYRDYWVSCLVNPSVARETQWDGDSEPPAKQPKEVLVVGGGPAGLEAARVAAARGHRVTLVEMTGELGGQFRLAAGQPERGEIGELLNWYQTQLTKLQVKVRLRHRMTAEEVKTSGADVVILATGSEPAREGYQRAWPNRDRLPGAEQDNVTTVHDVLDGKVVPGTRVLLLDDLNGWWPASGTALHLAQQRHQVTVVTASEKAAGYLDFSGTGSTTRGRFARFGIEVVTATGLKAWNGNMATLVNLFTGDEEEREFDTLVMATTNHPRVELSEALAGSGMQVHALGDAVSARTAALAFYEARKLALGL